MNKYSKIIYVSSIFLGMCSSDGYGTVNTAYLAKVSDISNVIAAIQTLSVQVTAINTAMSTSMVQGLSGLTGEGGVITQLRDNIQSLLDVANLPDAISNFLNSGDMTTLSNLITGLTEEGGIIPTLSNLITDLTEGGGIIPTLTGQITGLTEEGGVIPTLTGQITGLTGDEGDISNLSTSINGILTLLNTLSEQIQGLSGDIDLPTTSSITTAMGTAGFATVTDVTNAIAALTDEGGPITSISEAIDALTDPTTGPITSISEAIDALTDPTTGPITNISEAIDALTGTGGSITTAITEATTTITEAIDDLTGTNGPITGAITEATTTITEAIDALTDPTTGPITNISAAITALPNTITGATTTTVAQVRGMLIDSGLAEEPEVSDPPDPEGEVVLPSLKPKGFVTLEEVRGMLIDSGLAEEPEVSDPLDPEGEVVLPSLKPKGFVTLEEVRSMLIASGLVKADASGVGGVKSAGLVYDSGNTFEFSGGIYGSFKNYLTTLSDTIDSINDIKIGEAEIGLFEARFSGLTDYNNVLAVATGESHSDLTDENTPPTITNGDFMKILSLKDFVVEIKNMVYSSRDETGTKSLTFQDKKGNSYVTGETPWTNQLSTIVDSASTLNSLVISMQNEVSGPVAEKMSAYTNPYSITAAINYDSAHA